MPQPKKTKVQPNSVSDLLGVKSDEVEGLTEVPSEFMDVPNMNVSLKHLLMVETFRSTISSLNSIVYGPQDIVRCKASVEHVLKTAIAMALLCEQVYNDNFTKKD
jgi:hypothetical protein